jgi:hypothetical protein
MGGVDEKYPEQGISWLFFNLYLSPKKIVGEVLYLLVIGLSLLAALLHKVLTKTGKELPYTLILISLTLALVLEVLRYYTTQRSIQNLLLSHVGWVYLESCLLIAYFYFLEGDLKFRKVILNASVFILLMGALNSLFFQHPQHEFRFFTFLLFGLFLILLSIRFFGKIMNLTLYADQDLTRVPHFYMVIGMVFFYTEALFYMGTYYFQPAFTLANLDIITDLNRLMAGVMYLIFGFSPLIPHYILKKSTF